jgi:hypothetical protein
MNYLKINLYYKTSKKCPQIKNMKNTKLKIIRRMFFNPKNSKIWNSLNTKFEIIIKTIKNKSLMNNY